MVPGTGSAYLNVIHKPFETQADPAATGQFKLPTFDLPSGVDLNRVGERKSLLAGFDTVRRELDNSGQFAAMDQFQHNAWDILTSSAARNAFDLDQEPKAMREKYGFREAFDPKAANRCGCPNWAPADVARPAVGRGRGAVGDGRSARWWDTHVKGFESLREGFLPRWDQAYTRSSTTSKIADCWLPLWSSRGANSAARRR